MADYTPTLGDYTELKPFRFWCQKVLPLVYDDTLSYYELLCKVVDYLNKTMEDVDTLHDDVENLHSAYVQLQEYVNTYFDNLDVQEEINNKLNDMAQDGTLNALVSPFIPDAVSEWLRTNITTTSPAIDTTLSVAGAGADSSVTGNRLTALNDITRDYLTLNNHMANVYKANPNDSAYATGIQGTYINLLSNGTTPVVIPKSTRLLSFTLVCNSSLQKTLNVYLLENNYNNTFTVVKKFSNLPIYHKTEFTFELSLTHDAFIAIQQTANYTIWKNDNNSDQQTNMKPYTLGNDLDTAVGDVVSGAYQNQYYNIGANIDIFMGENFADKISNNSFMFKNADITEELGYFEGKGFGSDNIAASATIFNVSNYFINSTVSDTSYPLQIRDESGSVLNDIEIKNLDAINNDAWLIAEFDVTGKFLRCLTVGDFKTDGFSDDCYFMCARIYRNYNSGILLKPVMIDWLNTTKGYVYHVGTGLDFDTFTEMCDELKNDAREKTVYVHEGTYNIYQEYGGDAYMSALDPTGLNWRDVSYIVPENTHIIGLGKVVLTWLPESSVVGSSEKAFLFSPLNVDGSCTIENIEIVCQHCRYAIHDETTGNASHANITRKYINVKASKVASDYSTDQAYGCGLAQNGYYEFNNCVFESCKNWIFSMHDWTQTANNKTRVVINNTVIKKTGSTDTITDYCMGLGNTNPTARDNNIDLNNCWLCGKTLIYAEGGNQSVTENSFNIKEVGCNTHTITSQLTNNKELWQLN